MTEAVVVLVDADEPDSAALREREAQDLLDMRAAAARQDWPAADYFRLRMQRVQLVRHNGERFTRQGLVSDEQRAERKKAWRYVIATRWRTDVEPAESRHSWRRPMLSQP